MNKIFRRAGLVGILWLAGCASLPEEYRPQTVGPLDDGQTNNGVIIQLVARNRTTQLGQPVVFQVVVRNISNHAFWIPHKPPQGFFWTFPDGRHDCYFFDREQVRYFSKNDCVLLQPGHEIALTGLVDTAAFSQLGITEFRAEIDVARNTNPELTPCWSGRAFSNSFGVQLVPYQTSR
ncbi:MAG: hypothetical protein EPN23_09255 [Verrucomicrobia bacterium]|nr:MAG: hypothetical protein EPN23_09255 [Verrucomicrobiota bacterium]